MTEENTDEELRREAVHMLEVAFLDWGDGRAELDSGMVFLAEEFLANPGDETIRHLWLAYLDDDRRPKP